ncbi:MAG: hypothetical protein GY856_02165 [bacterium]|nr:hypothetical protein [bacterium]
MRTPEGLELHAAVAVKASDRSGLERLCRYLARPALSSDRLVRLDDGRIEFELKRHSAGLGDAVPGYGRWCSSPRL